MATAFNIQGAAPGLTRYGSNTNPSSQSTVGGTPASSALNIAASPNFSKLSGISNNIAFAPLSTPQQNLPNTVQPGGVMTKSAHDVGVSAGLIPQSTTQNNVDGSSSKITWTAPESTSSNNSSGGSGSSNQSLLNVPNNQGGYISGTPQAVAQGLYHPAQNTQPASQPTPPTPNASDYGTLITQVANSANNSPFVQQELSALNKAEALASQLANAEGTVSNTPGLLGTRSGTAQNIANAYAAEIQGLGQVASAANAAQGTQQSGLLGAGGLASPANTIITPPAGQVSTNVLTGQQYSNPVLAPVGTQAFYSPQPGGTQGQPPTAGQPTQYTIQSGDTFNDLASKYGTTAAAIEAANPGVNPNNLQVGSKVNIPTSPGANTPFIGGQAQAQANLGATYVQNNATITAAQGIQQKINADIAQNGINSLSSVNLANAVNQWIQGNLSNPNYANFFNDLTDYSLTIAPLIGINGTPTDMKTGIGQALVQGTASGSTITDVLDNLNSLAINKNNANLSAGAAPVGQGGLPIGQANAAANSNQNNLTTTLGNSYVKNPTTGLWEPAQ